MFARESEWLVERRSIVIEHFNCVFGRTNLMREATLYPVDNVDIHIDFIPNYQTC
jgi:hypothetical protein